MHFVIIILILVTKENNCDWVSDWLAPLEHQFKDILTLKNHSVNYIPEDENTEYPINQYLHNVNTKSNTFLSSNKDTGSKSWTIKLQETLWITEVLTTSLKKQIKIIETQEHLLKEAIANGRSGVTTLTVSILGQAPRNYMIRDGFWTLCNGMVQYPARQRSYNIFAEMFSVPRCIGQEITSKRDQCVFNSLIKYETIPVSRRPTYNEDDYLCLRASFNNTLENFFSVTRNVVDETCTNGVIRSLSDNALDCGTRVLSEYTYYPRNNDATSFLQLPLEYCTEQDGSCKLIVAWHLSNKTIENFEFLRNDQNFKKFFMKSESYIETLE